jgi:hypothetical protein
VRPRAVLGLLILFSYSTVAGGCAAENIDAAGDFDTRMARLGWQSEAYLSGAEMPKSDVEPDACVEFFELVAATDAQDPVASYANDTTDSYLLVKPMSVTEGDVPTWHAASSACTEMTMAYGSATVRYSVRVDQATADGITVTLVATDDSGATVADMLLTRIACADGAGWLVRTLNTSQLHRDDVTTHGFAVDEACDGAVAALR